ncbi:MAG: zinc-binding dehydrogenase [Hyphomicrobiaceae bacterium]
MKALVYTGPEQLVLRDEPDPQANEDIVVRVEACGICGSDMHGYLGHDSRRPAPLILGHEAAGIATSGIYEGKRVAINPLVTCGHCDDCLGGRSNVCRERQIISMPPRPGAFAELVRIPERNVALVPDGMAPEMAALTEPLATSYHAVNLGLNALVRPLPAARVAIIGGGAIGLGAARILASRGGRDILLAETNALRRARLDGESSLTPYDPAAETRPADSSIDLVLDGYGGKGSRIEASRLVAPGGVIVHIGLAGGEGGLDTRKLTLQEVTFIGTYTYTMVEFRETLAGLAAGIFGPLDWIEQRPLAEGVRAFADLKAGGVAAAKIVLRM